jgi:hypothetical protein
MAEPRLLGYIPLRSKDKKTLVQVFTDEEGLIMRVTVSFRCSPYLMWGSPIEVERIAD